jgi:hypothetical protein
LLRASPVLPCVIVHVAVQYTPIGTNLDREEMSHMKAEDLREFWGKLARAVGVQELPEVVKQELLKRFEQDITAAIGTGEIDDYLIEFARSFYTVHLAPRRSRRSLKKVSGKGDQEVVPEVGQYERLRADVLSEYLAKMAAINPEVIRFRSDVLTGELLTLEQARAFLSSPATRYLKREVWQTYGIPARHIATLLDENRGRTEDGPFHWVRLRTDPPGEEHTVFIPNPQSYDSLYLAEDGFRRITFWPGSVLGELRTLCKELTKVHPWDIDQATWFVLTGETPFVRPIRAKKQETWLIDGRAYTTISLTVQPWVPPEQVETVYRQLQKQVIGGAHGRVSDKNLNLLRFVIDRADGSGNLPKGKGLVKDWDKKWQHQRPELCYGANTRRFWRDFRNVQESVTNSKRAGLILEPGQYIPEEFVQEMS